MFLYLILAPILCLCLADLLVDMLGVLASYSITVKELKLFFSKLQGQESQWVSQSCRSVLVVLDLREECASNTSTAAVPQANALIT